jgi:hypothetical protein
MFFLSPYFQNDGTQTPTRIAVAGQTMPLTSYLSCACKWLQRCLHVDLRLAGQLSSSEEGNERTDSEIATDVKNADEHHAFSSESDECMTEDVVSA